MSKAKFKLDQLKTNPKNPRRISADEFAKLKESLQRDPQIMTVNPIVLNAKTDLTILAGEQRYKALKDLGYQEIPGSWVLFADYLTDEQKQKFIILDNHHSGLWDIPKLEEHFGTDLMSSWNIAIPDFNLAMPELMPLSGGQPVKQEKQPSATDNDYSVFELVMLHENKLQLLDTLNIIRQQNQFEKLEQALMHLVESFTQ